MTKKQVDQKVQNTLEKSVIAILESDAQFMAKVLSIVALVLSHMGASMDSPEKATKTQVRSALELIMCRVEAICLTHFRGLGQDEDQSAESYAQYEFQFRRKVTAALREKGFSVRAKGGGRKVSSKWEALRKECIGWIGNKVGSSNIGEFIKLIAYDASHPAETESK